jgi:predicted esterase
LEEKEISYPARNTFAVLNDLTPSTTHIWVVFHGMGYLSRYFLKYFEGLDPELHYFIAPQAPSKYYLNNQFKHVGASWLTKENTALEMENILSYLDALMDYLTLPKDVKLVIFGFSQGVSIALRWAVRRKVLCDHLILYAGGIPDELKREDVSFLSERSRIRIIVGTRDEYITPERWEKEEEKISRLFQGEAEVEIYEGGHEIKKEIINRLP